MAVLCFSSQIQQNGFAHCGQEQGTHSRIRFEGDQGAGFILLSASSALWRAVCNELWIEKYASAPKWCGNFWEQYGGASVANLRLFALQHGCRPRSTSPTTRYESSSRFDCYLQFCCSQRFQMNSFFKLTDCHCSDAVFVHVWFMTIAAYDARGGAVPARQPGPVSDREPAARRERKIIQKEGSFPVATLQFTNENC